MTPNDIYPEEVPATEFMTSEAQSQLSPESVLEDLIRGNRRFRGRKYTIRNHSEAIRLSAGGQYPKAFVLGCIDSRVPVEDIFDQGMGDIFVGRVAGNIATPYMIGSMEYACQIAGAKLILVLGHEQCGAIRGAIDGVQLGCLTELLHQLRPAVEMSEQSGCCASKDAFVHEVAYNNVRLALAQIRTQSEVLRRLEQEGEILICGAIYNLSDGRVIFLD